MPYGYLSRHIPVVFYLWPVLTPFLPGLCSPPYSLTAFSAKSPNKLFCTIPFTHISSLLYLFYSLSLSAAAANLFDLSTGTSESAGFSLFLSRPVLQIRPDNPSWEKRQWQRQSWGIAFNYGSSSQQLWSLNNKKLRKFTFLIYLIKTDDSGVGWILAALGWCLDEQQLKDPQESSLKRVLILPLVCFPILGKH